MASWTNLPQFQVQQATSIARMDQLLDNIVILSIHDHSGSAGDGASALGITTRGSKGNESVIGAETKFPPYLSVSQLNWDRINPCPQSGIRGCLQTSTGVSASGACVAYVFPLAPINLSLRFQFYGDTNSGCIAACLNGSQLTISGGSTYSLYTNPFGTTGIDANAITAPSGIGTLRIQVVGKDTVSGGFHAGVHSIGFHI